MLSWFKGKDKGETRRAAAIMGSTEIADALAHGAEANGYAPARFRDVAAMRDALPSFAIVVVAQGDQERDLEAARTLAGLAAPGSVIAVIAPSQAAITALQDLDAGQSALRIRPVSREARVARALLKQYSFGRLQYDGRPLHPVLFGTGQQTAQLAIQLFRMMHLPGLSPRATVVAARAEKWLAELLAAVPGIAATGMLTALTSWSADVAPPSAVYVCDAAAWDPGAATDWCVPVYWLPDAGGNPPGGSIAVVPDDWNAAFGAIFSDPADAQAEAIHQLYLEERRQAGETPGQRPNTRPWSELPERFRAASRHQADHIATKLAHIGCHIAPARGHARYAFTTEDREALAEAEHLRWAAVQMLDGWRYGPVRDDAAKTTPLLVPYAELTPEIRDLDRLSVRAIPSQLDRTGQTILRDLTIALRAPPRSDCSAGFDAGLARLFGELATRYPDRAIVVRTSLATAVERRVAEFAVRGGAASLDVTLGEPEALPPEGRTLALGAERIRVGREGSPPDLTLALGAGEAGARTIVLGSDGHLRSAPWL